MNFRSALSIPGWWLLTLAIAVGFFLNLGTPPLFDRDEGAFSEATREMIESGDFISPTLNFQPRYDKPVLIYWAQVPWVILFGPVEWAFRLASALAATLWTLATVRFVTSRWGAATGWASGIIMATSLGVMVLARAAIADALLNLWLALAFFDIWRSIETPRRRTLWRAFLWMGLGLLTKGPVAVVVPAGATFLYFALRRDLRTWLRCVFDPVGWLVMLAVAAPWYVIQFARDGMAFFDGFFMRHNVDRFSSPLEGHGGGFLYYLPVIVFVTLPFTALLARAFRRLGEIRQPGLGSFLWCWLLFVFVFFSLSGTKLPHYVLLAATPLGLLMAREHQQLRWPAEVVAPPVVLLTALLAVPRLVDAVRARLEDPYFHAVLGETESVFGATYTVAVIAAMLAIGICALVWRGQPRHALASVGIIQALVLALVVAPTAGELLQGPVKEAGLLAREAGDRTVRYGVDLPSFSVYRQRATAARLPRPGEIAVTESSKRVELESRLGHPVQILYERGGILLVRNPGPDRAPSTPNKEPP
jgi:4-amino-4-deoxy-L-arabinose transferase-like glycosyltransferase